MLEDREHDKNQKRRHSENECRGDCVQRAFLLGLMCWRPGVADLFHVSSVHIIIIRADMHSIEQDAPKVNRQY